ncbi:MAG: hypothetical protein R3335_14960 [Anaerolineales bacterium]|nr:hypothetical protein [Anaerolineales bacterium]
MTEEEVSSPEEEQRKRQGDAVSGGIFLISLGVLIFTGWWWPGIMVAIGLASGAGLIFRGNLWSGLLSLAFFLSIPIVVWIIQETDISWTLVGAWVLIGLGVIVLARAFIFDEK